MSNLKKHKLPTEFIDASYEAIRLANEVTGIKKGTNEVTKAIARGTAKLLLIAEDVDPPEVVAHLPHICKDKNIPFLYVETKEKLGEISELGVSAATICITDSGEGQKFINDIQKQLKTMDEATI